MTVPSMAFPGTQERRAAISCDIRLATGLDEAVLERLVRAFYASARDDVILGPLFEHVHDWETHIATITTFWSSVALLTGRYHGQPLATHFPLGLSKPHFERWLILFEKTARNVCTPKGAAYLMDKAHRIARSLEMGVSVVRGKLPARPDCPP